MAAATQTVKPTGKEDGGCTVVKGLLGYGKRRTIFNMKMDVDRVSMYLNKEDGSQLAMFVQEKFLFDLKVNMNELYFLYGEGYWAVMCEKSCL
jgi:vacuolar protein sorting-associated protein 13A/C